MTFTGYTSTSIKPRCDLIKDIALTLTHNPTWTLQINGHTDSIGDEAYNQKLSAARAKAVAAALIKRGIAGQRLQTAGLGPTQPKGDNSTLQGRALNRRVELVRTDPIGSYWPFSPKYSPLSALAGQTWQFPHFPLSRI